MTTQERIIYQIGTEIDQYINLVQEDVIADKNIRKFILEYVVPRFNKSRNIIGTYSIELPEPAIPTFEISDELPFNTK